MASHRLHLQAVVAVIIESILYVKCLQESLTLQASPTTYVVPAATAVKPTLLPPPLPPGPLPPPPPLPPLPTQASQHPPVPPLPSDQPTTSPKPTPGGNLIERWLDHNFLAYNLKSILRFGDSMTSFSCGISRCGKQERRLTTSKNGPKCFCDKFCVSLGDCCHDYKQSCESKSSLQLKSEDHEPSICKYKIPSTYFGVTVINSCSSRNPPSQFISGCSRQNETDVLTLQPVLDLSSNKTYGNVFCASCNHKKNVTLWSVQASCNQIFTGFGNSELQRAKLMDFISEKCSLRFYPQRNLRFHHRVCIPRLHSKHYRPINDSLVEEKLRDFCRSYAFPVCAITPEGTAQWFKNPHCMLYQGIANFDDAHTKCPSYGKSPLPPLTIFFDFQETKSFSVSNQLSNESEPNRLVERHVTCPDGQGYDVFSGKCRVFYTTETLRPKNKTGGARNCTYIKLTNNEFTLLDNGSLLHANRIVPEEDYYKINETIYLCANLTKNFTAHESGHSPQSTFNRVLSGFTVAGFAFSILGLISLVITYVLLPELRNLPGKIIVSLATTMLVYIVLYFFINQSDLHLLCHVVGIGLHFCLLSMFAWMNVMAFDIHYTFTRKGQNVDRSTGRCFFTGVYLKYALYAWLVPLLIITVSFSLEMTHTFPIGYASGPYCFISNMYAKVYTLAIPVGIILLYNTIALCHTLINIRKVQKQASKATNQKHQVDLSIVCVKMTSVMGVTWVLGYIASFKALAFLQYLHVILNSLQGFLIFISYVLNKRVFKMYRSYFDTMRGKHHSIISKRSTNISPTTP